MFDIFKKLLMARQIKFEEGRITLLGQRVLIVPNDLLVNLTLISDKNNKFSSELYISAKKAVKEIFAKGIYQNYKLSGGDFIKWLVDLAKMSGWGEGKVIRIDEENITGVLHTKNSPIATKLRGKVEKPVDHIWRGLMAGGATIVFKQSVDFIETKCIALGDPYCEFIFKPTKKFSISPTELMKIQLGL